MDENQNKPVTDAGKKPDEKSVAPTEKPAAVSASAATQPVAQSATSKSAPEKKPENVQSQPASSGPIDRTISSPSRTLVGDEPSEPSQKEVSSEKDRIDDEAQATRKRKPRKHTWYNSRPFIFACVIVLYVSALIGMVFMDSDNIVRDRLPWIDNQFMRDWYAAFNLQPFNVGITSWFFFFLFTAIGAVVFFALFFVKNIRDRQIRKRLENNKPVDQKWLKSFNIKYTLIFVLIGLVLVAGALLGFIPFYQYLGGQKGYNIPLNMIESMGIMILLMLIVPVFILILWAVLKLFVFLISSLTSSVAKTMMTTGDYQDFKAAAEASAASRRKDAGLPVAADYSTHAVATSTATVPQTVQVMIDPQKLLDASNSMGGMGGNHPKKDPDDHSGDLFPALMVIDRKWDGIHKKEDDAKAAAAKAEADQKAAQAKWVADCAAAKKQWDADCRAAVEAKKPLPPQPEILSSKSPDQLKAEADAKAKAAEEAKVAAAMAQGETKANDVVIGTAVQEAFAGNEKEIFELAQRNHKAMDYKDFTTLAFRFQSYLCHRKLYYPIDLIRSWIAGFAASRLILLEGLSGTGKSTLPRMFLEFVGGKAYFFPVQATWRDRSDIVGYYSDFTGQFKETELLKHLYEASYIPQKVNIMVLDEMNISRVEYYFADFLSIFEYPPADWLVPLMQVKIGDVTPRYIENGQVRIPVNTWFIGTVNVDDSTFTITDKVYDRAIVIDFKEINLPFQTDYPHDPYPLTIDEFSHCINEAMNRPENCLSDKEQKKFLALTDFVGETFDIRFGNRIMNQINRFVPVFVALGGTKEAALDIMFARKILRKLDGHFESYIKDGLVKLTRYLNAEYGKHVFKESEDLINKFSKKLA